MTENAFRSIINEGSVCFVDYAGDESFRIIENNQIIEDAVHDLEYYVNKIIDERQELRFEHNIDVLKRQKLEKENEQLKKDLETVNAVINRIQAKDKIRAKDCRKQGNIKKAIKFEESCLTLSVLKTELKKELDFE